MHKSAAENKNAQYVGHAAFWLLVKDNRVMQFPGTDVASQSQRPGLSACIGTYLSHDPLQLQRFVKQLFSADKKAKQTTHKSAKNSVLLETTECYIVRKIQLLNWPGRLRDSLCLCDCL